MIQFPVPVVGFAAFSGTGKTTLLTRLIPVLRQRGIRLAVVKHAHHDFDTDKPGKDSYELRKAGALQTLVASRRRWALITEREGEREPQLEELLERLDVGGLDLVLVEGFKRAEIAKIELHRKALRKPLLFLSDPNIIAVACDALELAGEPRLPVLDIDRPEQIADFIEQRLLGRSPGARRGSGDGR